MRNAISRLGGVFLATCLGTGLVPAPGMATEPNSIVETYGDWTVQCQAVAEEGGETAGRTCQVSQELRRAQTGQRILLFAVTTVSDAGAEGTVVAPFGLLLSQGVVIVVDDVELAGLEFRTCVAVGCIAPLSLTAEQLDQARLGEILGVVTFAANGQRLLTNLSLNGFDAALDRLNELARAG